MRFGVWGSHWGRGLVGPLGSIEGLESVINDGYTVRVRELEAAARETMRDTGNPFFRALQILSRLREPRGKAAGVGVGAPEESVGREIRPAH